MVHDKLDIDRWIREFPLKALRTEARGFVIARRDRLPGEYKTDRDFNAHIQLMNPKAEAIVGPRSIAVLEQLRQERLGGRCGGRRDDTDVVVWARGEPANRAATKVGGLPYWRESRPWPVSSENEPLEFIAQICFADSGDILGSLPDDMLLVFGHPDALIEEPP